MRFLAACRFLTIIPWPVRRDFTATEMGGSLVFFPVVGLGLGIILAVANWILGYVLPAAVVGFLLIIAITLLTGALHLDGLADTCDGLGGHTIAERHRIMHDSRAGTFGVAAITSVLLLKYLTLVNIPAARLTTSLILMPAAARWAMVYAITVFPYARPSGLGTVFKQGARLWHLAVASLLVLVAAGTLMHWVGLVILAVVWLVTWALAGFCRRQFAGLTGDNYGAVNEIGEVTVLLTVLLLARNGWLLD